MKQSKNTTRAIELARKFLALDKSATSKSKLDALAHSLLQSERLYRNSEREARAAIKKGREAKLHRLMACSRKIRSDEWRELTDADRLFVAHALVYAALAELETLEWPPHRKKKNAGRDAKIATEYLACKNKAQRDSLYRKLRPLTPAAIRKIAERHKASGEKMRAVTEDLGSSGAK